MSPTSPRPRPACATARSASSAWSSLGSSGETALRRIAGAGPAEPGPSRPRELLAPRDHSHRFADADYYHHVSMPRTSPQFSERHYYYFLTTVILFS